MFNILSKFIFHFKRPLIIIVMGENRFCAAEAVFQVLKPFFKVEKIQRISPINVLKNEILILYPDKTKIKSLYFFAKKSKQVVLLVTHIGEIPPDVDFFAGDIKNTREIIELVARLDVQDSLVLNFDDETIREIKEKTLARSFTFGLQEGADFKATDIHINKIATNFKINYRGNIIPVWLKGLFGKEQVYSALAAISVGAKLNLNLVELSQALKDYQSIPGKMRMIEGIKNSHILDDSENSSPFSMVEALEILARIKTKGRRIAILGDILGIGRYSIESHETIGEKVASCADLLFLLGPRSSFLAQGAQRQGMAKEKIFQFNEIGQLVSVLQDKIQENDLILVDGAKEMNMQKIVMKIKAIQ